MFCNGRQIIIFARVKNRAVGGCARSDDAHDFAAHEFFAGAGQLHLIAYGDFEAAANQARDVTIRGVIRHAAHGNGLALFAIAGGQSDLQFARGQNGIFVEEFVEIAEAKE